jgi:hypothetical protein
MSRNNGNVGFNRDIQSRMCQLEVLLVPLSLLRTNLTAHLQKPGRLARMIAEKSGYLSAVYRRLSKVLRLSCSFASIAATFND